MKKIGMIGFFNYGLQDIGGGVMKTRNYDTMVKREYGENNVDCLDRQEGRNPLRYILHFLRIVCTSSSILIFPTEKMLKTFLPVLLLFKKIYHYQILYIVIGGWLPDSVKNNKKLFNLLKEVDKIYVETVEMKLLLQELDNVECIPNFSMRKRLEVAVPYVIEDNEVEFCTYSRITREKGILDAIDAVAAVNEKAGKRVCKLTIYGQVWPDFETEFNAALTKHEDCIRYGGILGRDEAIPTISKCYMLLFPTYYQGEGFPGTLVESFMSGLPIIATDWKYNSEIIKEGYTGFIYTPHNQTELIAMLEKCIKNPELVRQMRENCIMEAKKYEPDALLKPLYAVINRNRS